MVAVVGGHREDRMSFQAMCARLNRSTNSVALQRQHEEGGVPVERDELADGMSPWRARRRAR